jgi:hypothetical protein
MLLIGTPQLILPNQRFKITWLLNPSPEFNALVSNGMNLEAEGRTLPMVGVDPMQRLGQSWRFQSKGRLSGKKENLESFIISLLTVAQNLRYGRGYENTLFKGHSPGIIGQHDGGSRLCSNGRSEK